jgi:hypothetical protein
MNSSCTFIIAGIGVGLNFLFAPEKLKQKVLCVDSFDDLKDLVVKDKWNF